MINFHNFLGIKIAHKIKLIGNKLLIFLITAIRSEGQHTE